MFGIFGRGSEVQTEKELAEKLKKGNSEIIIKGDLKKSYKNTRNGGSWVIASGAILVALAAVPTAPVTGGASLPIGTASLLAVAAASAVATAAGGSRFLI
ncbi:hypothetical protein KL86SPO_50336 [uncultured Sporomusa sp.]|uniref:Uncharacterized protein n=1 Tax=uncultured Sporomusa sp. TaxID=307249 RepID=A0A212LY97_9FIRM|nr:hypothetical protein [uncultured Sporomusa sp.]SCM82565.1 hypothetical protein KL86SPO_50336 [uncultured Sporomusa sp.]